MAWYDGLFAGNAQGQGGLSDDDKKSLANSGLLQAGLQTLAANSTPGVTPGQALAGGLLGGINSVQQGGQNLVKQRGQIADQQFQQAQQADQIDQMQRRRAIQDLALQFKKPDGSFDMPGYQQALAQQDPQAAMELHQNELKGQIQQQQLQMNQRDLSTPQTRKLDSGNNQLTQEQQPDGSWKTIATASRFAPQQSATSALAQRIALAKQFGANDDDIKGMLGFGGGLNGGAAPNPNGLQGADFVKTLPAADQPVVQAVIDGRYPVPTGKAATSPQWQRVVQLATQADPTFDAGTYASRAAARKNFTSGKIGEQIKSLNTLAGHLAEFDTNVDKLDNSDWKGINAVVNTYKDQRGDPGLAAFNLNAGAVGDELAKTFAGGQSALGDREHNRTAFAPNNGKSALKATSSEAAKLVMSRLQALQDQADQALGYGSRSVNVITPEARKLFQRFAGEGGGSAPIPVATSGASQTGSSDPLGIR